MNFPPWVARAQGDNLRVAARARRQFVLRECVVLKKASVDERDCAGAVVVTVVV
jgi:hypothetical protein